MYPNLIVAASNYQLSYLHHGYYLSYYQLQVLLTIDMTDPWQTLTFCFSGQYFQLSKWWDKSERSWYVDDVKNLHYFSPYC